MVPTPLAPGDIRNLFGITVHGVETSHWPGHGDHTRLACIPAAECGGEATDTVLAEK